MLLGSPCPGPPLARDSCGVQPVPQPKARSQVARASQSWSWAHRTQALRGQLMTWHPPAPTQLWRPLLKRGQAAAVPEVRHQQEKQPKREHRHRCGPHMSPKALDLQGWPPHA